MMHGRGGFHHGSDPPSKRYRRDDNADPTNPNPSIVVHVRNLHQKVTEADLLEALSTFGPIAYATCIPHSRMALVEFENLDGAKACVNYAATNNVTVGGQKFQAALFNYSTSQCIERMGFEGSTPNKVLVVTVLNATYPIDADVIHTISSSQGKVLRVAVMHKPTVVQALVEFESVEVAKAAKHAMNGADIYAGCCTLKVEFAKPDRVRVTRQDKDQRDFTLADHELPQDSGRRTLIPNKPDDHRRPYPEPRDQYDRYGSPQSQAQYGYSGRALLPTQDFYGNSGPPQQQGGGYYEEYNDRRRPQQQYGGLGGPGCVMMVYGLDHDKINCDMLFNILCQYGNVLRISFMRTKTETGIIEMGQPNQRQDVLDHLQGTELCGLKLEFKPSHQECVHYLREPFLLPDGTPSFKDYTSSRNQRFTTEELSMKNRIVFPTKVLHWFNAPGTMDEAKLLDMIAEKSHHKPIKVEVFPSRNERSAAGTVEFDTVEAANEVLALVNHSPVESPYGSAPFIVKWAYATPRRWDGSGGEPPRYEDGADGDRREGIIQPAARPFRRGGRGGGGDFGGYRRESYRGGLQGSGPNDRYNPYPSRGGGGFRGGRGRGRYNDY
ncbi:hypothetical protein L5515_013776 [Caenorhabditis briggsae]|uniref:RRM domain-containing protein n=2 Tax=Caenorhabditis briggsae TaxID=6238 RepID=A0AAE9E964_CAEBR|nr:hypothetical protein L5515_013776 [Caenorhabditis briggsae]